MSTQIKRKTVDVVFTKSSDGHLLGNVVHPVRSYKPEEKVLRMHFSLMGEANPILTPLSPDFSFEGKTTVYRYDWQVGLTPVEPAYQWNWLEEVAEDRAIVAQLLLDPGESGCGFSEVAALMLALPPSKDTSSWLERNADKLGESLTKLSDIAEPYSSIASNLMRMSAVMSNFVTSDGKEQKNWFLYRFVDEKLKCGAVEWNISRKVLHQYGPLLRGSLLLAFHGSEQTKQPLTMLLRPRINFSKSKLDFQPPTEQLESESPVAISITPTSDQG